MALGADGCTRVSDSAQQLHQIRTRDLRDRERDAKETAAEAAEWLPASCVVPVRKSSPLRKQ